MGKEIKGIVVPVVTPFRQDESINEDALRQIVNYLVGAGVHGLFPSGSQGEFWALTTDEKKRVMDVVIEEADGRVFVMPSTGAVTTRESIELTRHAERSGADAVSVITPFFIRPSADELRRHYVAIANSVSIPVLAYSNPDRTSLPITPAVAAAIAREAGNFAGIKDSSGDLTNTMAYIEECPPHFRTFMGRDTLIYAGLVYGCVGAVAATANVAPELVRHLRRLCGRRPRPGPAAPAAPGPAAARLHPGIVPGGGQRRHGTDGPARRPLPGPYPLAGGAGAPDPDRYPA